MTTKTHAARYLDPMLEKHLQRGVEDLFRAHGWRLFHRRDPDRHVEAARRNLDREGTGFPDLVCAKLDRIVVAELKRDGEPLAPDQCKWLDTFARSGVETYAWATRHYNLGSIELVARGHAHDRSAELVGRWEFTT